MLLKAFWLHLHFSHEIVSRAADVLQLDLLGMGLVVVISKPAEGNFATVRDRAGEPGDTGVLPAQFASGMEGKVPVGRAWRFATRNATESKA